MPDNNEVGAGACKVLSTRVLRFRKRHSTSRGMTRIASCVSAGPRAKKCVGNSLISAWIRRTQILFLFNFNDSLVTSVKNLCYKGAVRVGKLPQSYDIRTTTLTLSAPRSHSRSD